MRSFQLLIAALLPLIFACSSVDNGGDSVQPPEPEPTNFTVERKVLHEVFSASNCGPCFEAEENLNRVWEAFPGRYTVIDYQVGSDRYMTAESVARRFYYLPPDTENYSIPYVYADGVNGFHPNLWHSGAGEDADHYNEEDFESFASVPSHIRLELDHRIDGQTLTIDWSVTAGADFNSDDLVVHVVINEKKTTANVGSNGLTEFHHVMKKMLPNKLGSALGRMNAGDIVEDTYTYTFQGDYDPDTGTPAAGKHYVNHSMAHTVEEFDDLEVVIFVQDNTTQEVLQSEWSQ
jgi:hypothetical protein